MKNKPKRHECIKTINGALKHAKNTGHYKFRDLTKFKWVDDT